MCFSIVIRYNLLDILKWTFLKFQLILQLLPRTSFMGLKALDFAFIRKTNRIQPLIFGGEQERGLRAGTEAVYAIAGMAEALKISYQNLEKEKKYITGIKDYFKSEISKAVPGVKFNGACDDNSKSTYTVLNICFPIPPEKALMLIFQLDLNGIACSKGSACQSGSSMGSHVLTKYFLKKTLISLQSDFHFVFLTLKRK